MNDQARPAVKPANPNFSSGPCTKPPNWQLSSLGGALVGRSHRAPDGLAKLQQAIGETREILRIPDDFKVGIVPASDTGAVEMAMWSLLGERPVNLLSWENFGKIWAADAVEQLKVEAVVHDADYGGLPDLSRVSPEFDTVFTWNGTSSGVKVPDGDFISPDREGLTICDATSAVFAVDLPWDKLDATTLSWQKALGGEAAHGMLILSPKAVERLESYTPPWPLPKIFRLTKSGKLLEGVFEGKTINTPSMLCVEDYLRQLAWARSVGGLEALIGRSEANAAAVSRFVEEREWIGHLAEDPRTRSNTSVCLKFTDPRIPGGIEAAFAKSVAGRLSAEGVANDIKSYAAAPPGLRIWCGPTVECGDVEALLPWIEWAFETEMRALEGGLPSVEETAAQERQDA